MLTLTAGETIAGVAGTATAITYTIFGMELAAGVEQYKVLAQGQLSNSAGTLYTCPANTQTFVKSIHLANPTSSEVSGVQMFQLGTATGNRLFNTGLRANGMTVLGEDGMRVFDASGNREVRIIGLQNTSGSRYTYSSTTTAGDPGVGTFRFNQAVVADATKMYISKTSQDSFALGTLMAAMLGPGATIQIQDASQQPKVTAVVNSVTDGTTYYELDIYVPQGSSLTNGDNTLYFNIQGARAETPHARGSVFAEFPYTFDSTTTSSDPGAGKFRFNATMNAVRDACNIIIDDVDNAGVDHGSFFGSLAADVNSSYRLTTVTLRAGSVGDAGVMLKLNAVVRQPGYWILGGQVMQQAPASPPSNGSAYTLAFQSSAKGMSALGGYVDQGHPIFGVPGFQMSHILASQALAINTTHLIPFIARTPILIQDFVMHVTTAAACAARFSVYRAIQRPDGQTVLGDLHDIRTAISNHLNTLGIRTSNVNMYVPPGYWWACCQVTGSGSPVLSMPGGDFENNMNVDWSTTTPNVATGWTINNSGGVPAFGDTIVRASASLGAGVANSMQSKLPFFFKYSNIL